LCLSLPFADSGDEGGLFPLAALFTGALLTIGLAVLLIVFIALRKNRAQTQTHENGMKEKHIGERRQTGSVVAL
jgi:hypothetical protein